jgi:hypothetical protein
MSLLLSGKIELAASTTTVEPVENGVDAKNYTAFATSEDSPMRRSGNPSGALANIASRSVSGMPAHNGVAISRTRQRAL